MSCMRELEERLEETRPIVEAFLKKWIRIGRNYELIEGRWKSLLNWLKAVEAQPWLHSTREIRLLLYDLEELRRQVEELEKGG